MESLVHATREEDLDDVYFLILGGCEFACEDVVVDRDAETCSIGLQCKADPYLEGRLPKQVVIRSVTSVDIVHHPGIDSFDLDTIGYLPDEQAWELLGVPYLEVKIAVRGPDIEVLGEREQLASQ